MRAYQDLKIAVAGTGYVGLSMATLLSQHHEVVAVDVIPEKVEKINNRVSPIQDEYIEKYFAEKDLHLTATLDGYEGRLMSKRGSKTRRLIIQIEGLIAAAIEVEPQFVQLIPD